MPEADLKVVQEYKQLIGFNIPNLLTVMVWKSLTLDVSTNVSLTIEDNRMPRKPKMKGIHGY